MKKSETDKKNLFIHKRNELIRGSDKYSLLAKRAMNTIYFALQKDNLYSYRFLTFKFITLKDFLGLQNNADYISRIKDALMELMETLELYNFEDPINKRQYKWFATRFLNEARIEKQNNEWVAIIEVNQTIKDIMRLQGNFTQLDIVIFQNKIRTKYAMKLYEYLKSFNNYVYLELSMEQIKKVLGIEESRTYRYFGDLKRLIDRQIKEIAKKTDLKELKLVTDKKSKTFRFLINSQATNQAPTKQETKEKLNSLLQKAFVGF